MLTELICLLEESVLSSMQCLPEALPLLISFNLRLQLNVGIAMLRWHSDVQIFGKSSAPITLIAELALQAYEDDGESHSIYLVCIMSFHYSETYPNEAQAKREICSHEPYQRYFGTA